MIEVVCPTGSAPLPEGLILAHPLEPDITMNDYKEIVRSFFTEDKIKHIFEQMWQGEGTNNPFILATKDQNLIKYSACCRSIDSRLGNFMEKLAKEIVQKGSFKTLSEVQKQKMKQKLNAKPDLCFFKDHYWNIIELKAGGNIDSKKMKAERASLDKIKLYVSKVTKQKARFFYATAYQNIEDYSRLNFSSEELLIGKKFWEFICDDSKSYHYILKKFSNKYQKIHLQHKE